VTPAKLKEVEPSIPIAAGTNAYISAAEGTATGYVVTAMAATTKNTYTITNVKGVVSRTCAVDAVVKQTGGCSGGVW
jgi:hypothetical protein